MTRPTTETLDKLARTLDEALAHTNVDRLWRPTATTLLLDCRALGKRRLLIDLEQRHPRVIVTPRWPETPASPDRETLVLRRLLEGIRVERVRAEDERRLVVQCQPRHDTRLRIVVQLAGRYPNVAVLDDAEAELVRLVAARPGVDPDAPALPVGPDPRPDLTGAAWLEAIAEATWLEADRRALELARDDALRLVRRARDKIARRAAKHEAELAASAEAPAIRHRGDLLKSALHRIRPGDAAVEVHDWADPEGRSVTLVLDPTLTAAQHLERTFARYRKLVRTQAEAERRLEAAWSEDEALIDVEAALAAARDLAEVTAAAARLGALGVHAGRQAPPRRADDPTPRLPYRRFTASDGSVILVGRSARDNDALTFRVASGRDLFLHARDVPGSHVILRTAGRAPSHEALVDAATLAAWNSQARSEALVDVLWTERKHVRKVPGVAGRVSTADARTLAVRVEQARVDRLYGTLESRDGDDSP